MTLEWKIIAWLIGFGLATFFSVLLWKLLDLERWDD